MIRNGEMCCSRRWRKRAGAVDDGSRVLRTAGGKSRTAAGHDPGLAHARTLERESREEIGDLLPLLATLPVRDLEIVEPALEDVLRSFYRETQRERTPSARGHSLRRRRGLLAALSLMLIVFQIFMILTARNYEQTGGFRQIAG